MTFSTVPYALVVDDDALILMHECDILEEAGFRCRDAGTGDEAIQVLDEYAESIILLFSDVEMPGSMDGFALARQVAERCPTSRSSSRAAASKPRKATCPTVPPSSPSHSTTTR